MEVGKRLFVISEQLEIVIMWLSPVFWQLYATIQADGCTASSDKVFYGGGYSNTKSKEQSIQLLFRYNCWFAEISNDKVIVNPTMNHCTVVASFLILFNRIIYIYHRVLFQKTK